MIMFLDTIGSRPIWVDRDIAIDDIRFLFDEDGSGLEPAWGAESLIVTEGDG